MTTEITFVIAEDIVTAFRDKEHLLTMPRRLWDALGDDAQDQIIGRFARMCTDEPLAIE